MHFTVCCPDSGLSGSAFAVAFERISAGTIDTVEGIVEPKVHSNATLDDDFADNRVMVVLNNAASLKLKTYTAADFPEIQCASVNDFSTAAAARVSAKLRGENVAEVFGAKSGSVVSPDYYDVDVLEYNQILCLTLPTAGKQNVLTAIKLLMQRDDVKYAGPDYYMQLFRTPNDSQYSRQQLYANLISLPQAWDITTGTSAVRIGIIDSGIYGDHPDLQRWVSDALSVDCTSGGCNSVTAAVDSDGHGTGVAGIIGAEGDNEMGIAGVAWKSTLVSLRVTTTGTSHPTSNVIRAINYATSIGLHILNYSGGSSSYNADLYAAINNYPGLFVCAAGNGDNSGNNIDDNPVYPACFNLSKIITVGNCQYNNTVYYKSNYGKQSVDLFAPGTDVYSTSMNGGITLFTGTSFAAPYVTGVAALILAECPRASTIKMKQCIVNYTDAYSEFTSKCVSGGRLNAYKAVKNAHTFTYTKNATTHTGTCACGEAKTEAHTFTAIGNRYTCVTCGYITTNP